MKCPSCGCDNREGAKFCGECAAPLAAALACRGCGTANPKGRKFCDSCGRPLAEPSAPDPRSYTPKHLVEKILTTRSALEGERKQVTVLFADVKGSMDLAEQVDPEEWHKIMDRFFAILSEGVHRFEGTINQYTGDGIMALFGAPIAHEDHARRACFAALHLQKELRRYADDLRLKRAVSFSVRIGLNSGEVVVGKIGDDLRMDYTAQGHTVGLAARMEQIAEPGTIYAADKTAGLVQGFFQLRDLGTSELKGVSRPVRIYELEGTGPLRTAFDVRRARGLSRFVGRAGEMASLEAALSRALERSGQVVGVVAEAGVGKSRLCYEFVERSRARGVAAYQARGLAHGKAIPFLPVLEILREYFGITDRDGDRAAREKIAGRLLLLERDFEEVLPLVFDFLGVTDSERPPPRAMGPEERQAELFRFVKRLIHAHTRREPLIVVFEDLHWWDPGSLAFMDNQAEIADGTRMLTLVNFRPEYHAAWMQKSYYQQVPLLPLDGKATAEMVRDLVGDDVSVHGLAERIRERTAGNPFFIEEVVQSLVETGYLAGTGGSYRLTRPIDQVSIPATVQTVLAARIDRLRERDKTVLQTSAVIGKEFSEAILKRISDLSEAELAASLHHLTGAEFLYEKAIYPEAEFAFKHPLTQEVAYGSPLAERRARTHAAVARAIAELYPDKLDERAALLAHHWECAGEPVEAARWHARAAEWAGINDPGEALRHYVKVRDLLGRVPEFDSLVPLALEARTRIINFAFMAGLSDDEVGAVFIEARKLATRINDLRGLANLLAQYGVFHYLSATPQEGLEPLEEAVRLADQAGDAALKIGTRFGLFNTYFFLGRVGDSLALSAECLEMSRAEPTLLAKIFGFSGSWILGVRGMILTEMGRFHDAADAFRQCDEAARRLGETQVLSWNRTEWTFLCERSGDADGTLHHARQAVEFAERSRSSLALALAYSANGLALLSGGRWREAADSFERSLATSRQTRAGLFLGGFTLTGLARAYFGMGEAERALATAKQAVQACEQARIQMWECRALLALARMRQATCGSSGKPEIDALLRRAALLIQATGARSYEPFLHVERAELARLNGDEVARQRELREAHRLFLEIGAPIRAEQVAKELAG